jgi:hypothetical protein
VWEELLRPIPPGCNPEAAKSILSMTMTPTYKGPNIAGHF